MINGEEAAQAIESVARLAMFDHQAGAGFGKDLAACRRSFLAYVIVLPVVFFPIIKRVVDEHPAHPLIYIAAHVLAFIMTTAGFPILLIPLLRAYRRPERWVWFVTGYNWFNAAAEAFIWGVAGLCFAGFFAGLGLWPVYAAQVYTWVLEAFLAEAMLQVGGVRAAGIVLLDIGFGVLVDATAKWIGTGNFGL
jgi:hypothetical protein